MNKSKQVATSKIRLLFPLCTALAGILAGCIGYVEEPRRARVYVEPAPVIVQPEYVYYPGYQVYYSSNTRQYVYRDGRAWVSRPAPPGVSVDVLFASPSVRLDFHDHPSLHHATVARRYPGNWQPPGPNHGRNPRRGDRD